jgi:DNA-binding transcriptional MerR regulator
VSSSPGLRQRHHERPGAEPERREPVARRVEKSPSAFRTISEVADELNVPQHVLRFWETKFPQVRPLKRGGGRRYYRPEDVELLRSICSLLYREGYTIKGVQRLLREGAMRDRGPASTVAEKLVDDPPPPPEKVPAATRGAPSTKAELRALAEELTALRDRLRRLTGR